MMVHQTDEPPFPRFNNVKCIAWSHTSWHQIEHPLQIYHLCMHASTLSYNVPTSELCWAELRHCWGKCFWKVSFEAFKSIITILVQISFHSTPEELNEVQLTVKFEKNAQMSSIFNDFLNTGFLCKRVWLLCKGCSGTAISGALFWLLTFQLKTCPPKSTSMKHKFYSFWLSWSCWMICRKNHRLGDAFTIVHSPSIMHNWLSSRFILCTKRASFGYAAWPYELSTIIRAW